MVIEYRFDIDIMYRIARGNIEIFDIPVLTFWLIDHLPNFHLRVNVMSVETFTEFFIVRKFLEILNYYLSLLVRFYKQQFHRVSV